MNYSALSDDQINHEVLRAIHGDVVDYWALSDCGTFLYDCGPIGEDFYRIDLKDYCSDPADAWPVIDESRIAVHPAINNTWCASKTFHSGDVQTGEVEALDKNPLRAAMIVFLKMNRGDAT